MTTRLTDAERDALSGMWAFRARSEHEATRRFTRLAERLRVAGAAPAIVDLATVAIEDERRHRGACAAMAERFGHPTMSFDDEPLPEVAPPGLGDSERVLYETVAFCAVTESINAALLAETQKASTDPETHRVVRDILSDEVNHSRIGWAYLASTAVPRAFLAGWLPFMLDATLPEALFAASDEGSSETLLGFGLLPPSALQRIFRDTMLGVIVPGLEQFGVDTTLATRWMAEHAT